MKVWLRVNEPFKFNTTGSSSNTREVTLCWRGELAWTRACSHIATRRDSRHNETTSYLVLPATYISHEQRVCFQRDREPVMGANWWGLMQSIQGHHASVDFTNTERPDTKTTTDIHHRERRRERDTERQGNSVTDRDRETNRKRLRERR